MVIPCRRILKKLKLEKNLEGTKVGGVEKKTVNIEKRVEFFDIVMFHKIRKMKNWLGLFS